MKNTLKISLVTLLGIIYISKGMEQLPQARGQEESLAQQISTVESMIATNKENMKDVIEQYKKGYINEEKYLSMIRHRTEIEDELENKRKKLLEQQKNGGRPKVSKGAYNYIQNSLMNAYSKRNPNEFFILNPLSDSSTAWDILGLRSGDNVESIKWRNFEFESNPLATRGSTMIQDQKQAYQLWRWAVNTALNEKQFEQQPAKAKPGAPQIKPQPRPLPVPKAPQVISEQLTPEEQALVNRFPGVFNLIPREYQAKAIKEGISNWVYSEAFFIQALEAAKTIQKQRSNAWQLLGRAYGAQLSLPVPYYSSGYVYFLQPAPPAVLI